VAAKILNPELKVRNAGRSISNAIQVKKAPNSIRINSAKVHYLLEPTSKNPIFYPGYQRFN
jgi:hypothetical protein